VSLSNLLETRSKAGGAVIPAAVRFTAPDREGTGDLTFRQTLRPATGRAND